jgi:hypothetical protein
VEFRFICAADDAMPGLMPAQLLVCLEDEKFLGWSPLNSVLRS